MKKPPPFFDWLAAKCEGTDDPYVFFGSHPVANESAHLRELAAWLLQAADWIDSIDKPTTRDARKRGKK